MSGKNEKHDISSSNSKVLQKAKSFRDDIKHRIIRRSPSNQRDKDKLPIPPGSCQSTKVTSPSPSRKTSPKKERKKINRGSSFKEESKTEKLYIKQTDIEKLKTESNKVHHALHGFKVLVDKDMLHMLPGSATLVLETVMELNQYIGNFLVDNDSTLLLCAHKQVYQSLAAVVQWADEVLLQQEGQVTVSGEISNNVIKALEDAVKELLNHATEKLENKALASPYGNLAPRSPGVNGCKAESKQRASLPDIPLTPREKEILETTGEQLNYSSNNNSSEPPPKPPLPSNFKDVFSYDGLLPSNAITSTEKPLSGAAAPPLPPKKRTPSTSSLYDNHNAVDHLWSQSGICGFSETASAQYNPADMLRSGSSSLTTESSQDSSSISGSDVSSTFQSPTSLSSTSTLNNAAAASAKNTNLEFSPGEFYNQRQRLASDEVTLRGESLSDSVTESSLLSRSKLSSNNSNSDVNSLQSVVLTSANHSTAPDGARLSQYDNFDHPHPNTIGDNESSQQAIQSLTQQIHQLTANMDNETQLGILNMGNIVDSRPPLPNKKNQSLTVSSSTQKTTARSLIVKEQYMRGNAMSQYDNFPSTVESFTAGAEALNMAKSSFFSSSGSAVSAMKTSHSAFEFSASSSSSSSSASSVSYHKVNSTTSFTKSEQVAGESPTVMRGTRYEQKQAYVASGSVKMRSTVHGNMSFDDGSLNPPPLPPKKIKTTVQAYMGMFGQYTSPNIVDLNRHSLHAATFYKSKFQQHQLEVFHPFIVSRSNTLSVMSDISSGRGSDVYSVQSASSDDTAPPTPPFPPKLPIGYDVDSQDESSSPELRSKSSTLKRADTAGEQAVTVKVIDNYKQDQKMDSPKITNSDKHLSLQSTGSSTLSSTLTSKSDLQVDRDSMFSEASSTLDDTDVSDLLVRKKPGEEDPDIRGGTVDALIVHATTAGRKEILFQEAFVTTYRTFISPRELIEKLLYRYHRFSRMEEIKKKKLSRNAFSLLIRVTDELCTEIDDIILKALMDLVYQLLTQGELMLGKILRRKVLEKVEQKKQMQLDSTHHLTLWESHHMTTKQYSLLEFKPENIAEQMTLLDSELFLKIEIPEVLLWAQDQNEEQSPNLTKFTEHFNKMSYWCRTQILQQEDAKDREKYLVKFIKLMKFLRKYNNFNSYLAILSALDSAPIRRLEWQKHNTESMSELSQLIDSTPSFRTYRQALAILITELSQLIDSTSSFRNYRQALVETVPPCIPYIGSGSVFTKILSLFFRGIILQDLTFVHIGNQDNLAVEGCSSVLNFAKRWQQFNILDNMKRFKKCDYNFKKNHKIIAFFNGFEDNLCEESLWQISEAIKPRGGKKKHVET